MLLCKAINPIWFSDPFGDTVKIEHRAGFLGLGRKQTLTYEGGNLFNADGSEYEGRVRGFLGQTVNALNTIGGSEEGGNMLAELEGSENVFTIKKSHENRFSPTNSPRAFANQLRTDPDPNARATFEAMQGAGINLNGGSGGTIFWNPRGGTLVPEQGGFANRPSIFLGHELFHGLDANRGLLDSRTHLEVPRSEWQAVLRENIMRQQLGLPLRTHYRSSYNPGTGERRGLPPNMLNPDGSPILPAWYAP